MHTKNSKKDKRKCKNSTKQVKENFDAVFESYIRQYFVENYPANAGSNSGQIDPARMNTNNVNPTAGMPAVNAQGNNPQAFQKVQPNNASKQPPQKLDPKFLNALKQAHNPNNPNAQQTEQAVKNLMSQPNAPMIDQNSAEYQNLPQEVQNALKKHSNNAAQQNNYQSNIQKNNVKQPATYQNQNVAPAQNNTQQQSQRPPQQQGSVGGVV